MGQRKRVNDEKNVLSMRWPKTKTIFLLAGALFLVAGIIMPNWYPPPIPVLGSDGNPLLKPNGSPVIHRDMTQFDRDALPGIISFVASVLLFGWGLVRLVKRR